MNAPRWAVYLVEWLASPEARDEVVGDLEEAHRRRVDRVGRFRATLYTSLEALDMSWALWRDSGGARSGRFRGISSLDLKLSFRMLVRYPALTVLGGLAIAFAILVSSTYFEIQHQFTDPDLGFQNGDRLVGIQMFDRRSSDGLERPLWDAGIWNEELTTVEDVGAFTSERRNLIAGSSGAHLARAARINASAFRVTSAVASLGRTLTDADERPGAPLVVVLGHDLWQRVFHGADPIGRSVRFGSESATVVGVMPEGFAFPVRHELWLPLRHDRSTLFPDDGPEVQVFGMLAEGVRIERAQAELDQLMVGVAAEHPEARGSAAARIRPYSLAMIGIPASISESFITATVVVNNLPALLFLLLVAGNVALLMYARSAGRRDEMAVRTALGASRRRIVGQLFVEALVLAGLGAAVGLAAAGWGLRIGFSLIEIGIWRDGLPFWIRPELSGRTMAYAVLLTLLTGIVAGVLPGLRATRGLGDGLRRVGSGSQAHPLGRIGSVAVVSQIALTVLVPAAAWMIGAWGTEMQRFDPGYEASRFLSAKVAVESDTGDGTDAPAIRATLAGFEERLLLEPRVTGVTFASQTPRRYSRPVPIETDLPMVPEPGTRDRRVPLVRVTDDFFGTLEIAPRAGRDFTYSDAAEGAEEVVIVNEAFVRDILGGRNAVGARLRVDLPIPGRDEERNPRPWSTIVGVVQDLGEMADHTGAIVYIPMAAGDTHPVALIAGVTGDARSFITRFYASAFETDPTLRLRDVVPLDEVINEVVQVHRTWTLILLAMGGIAVLLSLGGIYAVTSFTVAQRTREIGVRVALGSSRVRVVFAVFKRPLVRVAIGLTLGALLTGAMLSVDASRDDLVAGAPGFGVWLLIVTLLCLLGGAGPTARTLAIEPSEALRAE